MHSAPLGAEPERAASLGRYFRDVPRFSSLPLRARTLEVRGERPAGGGVAGPRARKCGGPPPPRLLGELPSVCLPEPVLRVKWWDGPCLPGRASRFPEAPVSAAGGRGAGGLAAAGAPPEEVGAQVVAVSRGPRASRAAGRMGPTPALEPAEEGLRSGLLSRGDCSQSLFSRGEKMKLSCLHLTLKREWVLGLFVRVATCDLVGRDLPVSLSCCFIGRYSRPKREWMWSLDFSGPSLAKHGFMSATVHAHPDNYVNEKME